MSVRLLAEDIIEQWAIRYAEKQVLYDKSRALQPIIREIALSRQFADSQQIREWARDPDDEALTARAMTEMENFRLNFADRSYFVALLESGRYYHNNADNEYAGREFRYVLDPDKPADSWFYDIIEQQRDMHLNVNPDIPLGVTKLWIDVLLRDGQQILGVVGTGLDLTQFLEKVVDERTPGITSLFVDHQGRYSCIATRASSTSRPSPATATRRTASSVCLKGRRTGPPYGRRCRNSRPWTAGSSPASYTSRTSATWPASPTFPKSTGTRSPSSISRYCCRSASSAISCWSTAQHC
ncbi:hypothetical protein [Marinobacterium aestuariivivens]|uniref:Cache domain-containing protein n=1 Tax=Marinobacterium aestuariivivens TaxID=1698799 RepID=A0ABW2A6V5_9GAMM